MEANLNEKRYIFFNYKELICCFLIAAYSSNFMNIGHYIPILFLPFILYYVFKNRFSSVFYITSFVLMSFSIIYTTLLFFYNFSTLSALLARLIFPISLYILGDMLVKNDYQYKKTLRYLFLIIVSSTMYGFLSLIKTITVYGNMKSAIASEGRVVMNLWGG